MKTSIDRLVAPNASAEYRDAREKPFATEKNLMQQIEQVAQMRRDLPQGPQVHDYEFTGLEGSVRVMKTAIPFRQSPSFRRAAAHCVMSTPCIRMKMKIPSTASTC